MWLALWPLFVLLFAESARSDCDLDALADMQSRAISPRQSHSFSLCGVFCLFGASSSSSTPQPPTHRSNNGGPKQAMLLMSACVRSFAAEGRCCPLTVLSYLHRLRCPRFNRTTMRVDPDATVSTTR